MGSKLTCAPIDPAGSHWATAPSLDWLAAAWSTRAPRAPLVLSVGNAFANVKGILSYKRARQTPYTPETNPKNVYSKLTGCSRAAGPRRTTR